MKAMKHIIDAKNKRLGRLAVEIVHILQGKKSPSYEKNAVSDDIVLVKNAKFLTVSGSKEIKKTYYHHTGYMGHLRKTSYKSAFAKSPAEVLRRAVFNMLPKNWIRQDRLNNLTIEN